MLSTSHSAPTTPVTDQRIVIDPVLFEIGVRDGKVSMMRGSLCDNASYLAGFRAGIVFYRCSIPAVTESPLERGHGDELLNPLN